MVTRPGVRIRIPDRFNRRIGRRRYTEEELERLAPTWWRLYRKYSFLSDSEIAWLIDQHIAPNYWPGTAIMMGKNRAVYREYQRLVIDKEFREEVAVEVGFGLTRKMLLRFAVKIAETTATDWARAYHMDEENIFKYEYYLTSEERRSLRRKARERRGVIPSIKEVRPRRDRSIHWEGD